MCRARRRVCMLLLWVMLLTPASTVLAEDRLTFEFDLWEWILNVVQEGFGIETQDLDGSPPTDDDDGDPPADVPPPVSDAGMFVEPGG